MPPTSATRQRVEIPLDLHQALNQAAADAVMPTSALITTWLYRLLEARRPALHIRDPDRSGIEQYERRPRRAGELPDDVALSTLLRPVGDATDDAPTPTDALPPPAKPTTVPSQPQAGGILLPFDSPPT